MNEENSEKSKKLKKKTILIFGVSSFVGSNLANFFKNEFRVVGTYYKNRTSIPGILTLRCDILVKEEVQMFMYTFRPDITIYAAGYTSITGANEHEELADAINTGGLFNVTEYCQRYKSQICYISSGFVFGGEQKSYVEMDIPDSTTTFGKTKASAEFYLQKNSLNYLLFRCGNLYGRGINCLKRNWFEVLQDKLFKGELAICDHHIRTGHLDIYYLAMIMKTCFNENISNRLFQVSSSDHMTAYEFAKNYCEVFGDSLENISKGKWKFPIMSSATTNIIGPDYYYELDISNIENFLNSKLPTVKESLEFTYSRLDGKKLKGARSDDIKFI